MTSLALAGLVLLPLGEIVLRRGLRAGLGGAIALQQHLTLLIGLLGGMVAAREGRLLALSTVATFLKGRWQVAARIFSGAGGAAVSAFLCVAAAHLVQAEREAGKILAYGIPLWAIQLVMPLGFAVIALRLLWRAADGWAGRLMALLLAGGLVGTGLQPPVPPGKLVLPALVTLLAAVVLGAPIFVMLGGAALILFWGQDVPIASISLTHYSMVTNPTLPTVPLFTLAGYFLACAFFTSFTGVSGVTILALGGRLMPALTGAGYAERSTLGLLTGAGGLGLLFPPSLPLILYAIVASASARAGGVTIERMFLGGLGPGVLLVAMAAWWGVRLDPKQKGGAQAFDAREAGRAIWTAKGELLLPVVALVALFGGFATPVEAAAVTAPYAFVVEAVIYREFRRARDIPRVMTECGLLVGGVLLILGVALGFTNYLIDAQVPARAVDWVTGAVRSKYAFLLALNLSLLAVGCVMDMYSAIVVVVPLIVPLGLAYGIDPIHLGIIFLANMELGLLTPTVGINIFLSAYRFQRPVLHVSRAVIPMQCVLLIGVLLISYLPPLTTLLPRWYGR